MREVDYIINTVKQYPRPRMKRQVQYEDVEYFLTNLPPYSEICVQIRVLNKYYVGPPSSQVCFYTEEAGGWSRSTFLWSHCSTLQFIKNKTTDFAPKAKVFRWRCGG